jgi:hypothetical protein
MRRVFQIAPPVKQKLILLGAHLEGQTRLERAGRDTAVKKFLIQVDDLRMHALGNSSLRGTHERQIEGVLPDEDWEEEGGYVEELYYAEELQ